jgi:hypothetical protein
MGGAMFALKSVLVFCPGGRKHKNALLTLYVNYERTRLPIVAVTFMQGWCKRTVSSHPHKLFPFETMASKKLNLILAVHQVKTFHYVLFDAITPTMLRMFRSCLKVIVKTCRVARAICASFFAYHLSMQGRGRTWQWRVTVSWRTTTLSVRQECAGNAMMSKLRK